MVDGAQGAEPPNLKPKVERKRNRVRKQRNKVFETMSRKRTLGVTIRTGNSKEANKYEVY